MDGGWSLLVLLVLSSCILVGGQNCSLTDSQFLSSTVTASAKSVSGSTPGVRVTWNTTLPPECVTSVWVNFKGVLVATNTTTNISETEIIQTGLPCYTNYYIRVIVAGEVSYQGVPRLKLLSSSQVRVRFVGDIPYPVGVRAEVTADNTSIRVSWQWSRQGVVMCIALVRVRYRPEGGSLMSYTVGNTTATSATLPNLQCNTEYTIWVYAEGGQTGKSSVSRTAFLQAPSTPIDVTVQLENTSSVRVGWQWSSLALSCFNTTTVTYHPEGGGESFLQLSDPAATEATLTNLHNNTCYIITVVATAGENRRESVVKTVLPQQDPPDPVGVRAEATADNTSIRVSWEWSPQGVVVCFDFITVHYQPEGGSLMVDTVDNTTATSAILSNLQCNTKYTIWIQAKRGRIGKTSVFRTLFLPPKAPPTPTEVTTQFMSASSVKVSWQWTRSGLAPDCFNTTTVTYHPEGGSESFLQLSDPAANEATLTDLQCNTSYAITVVATAGEHRRESVASLVIQGPQSLSASVLSSTSIHLTWVAPCDTQQYHIYYRGTCGTYVDEGRLDTAHQGYTFDGLQEGVNYSFTVNQTGFSGGTVLSTGPVYAKTFSGVPSGAPQSLEARFVQPTEVLLRWREVPCVQQNGPITGYVVRYYATCGADKDVQQYRSVVARCAIIEGLTRNTEYAFQVAAVNVNGTGQFSEPITLGGAPQLVMVTPVNSTTVTVSWSEVQCFNGSETVTQYLVQYWSICGGAVQNVTTSGIIQTFSGLIPNYMYTFQVAVVGASQKIGPFSNPVSTVPYCADEPSCDSSLDEPQSVASLVAVAGVAVTAVLVLLVVAVVQSAVIWHQRKSIAKIKSQKQRATAKTTEIPLKDCSAYGQIDQGGGAREETYIYEHPQ